MTRCPTCGRAVAANVNTAVSCCGRPVPVAATPGRQQQLHRKPTQPPAPTAEPPADTTQSWAHHVRRVCNSSCPHWGTISGSTGCTLLPEKAAPGRPHRPCDIGYYHHLGFGCFANPKRYRSAVSHVDPVVPDNVAAVQLITVHFNPTGARRLADTYREWLDSLGDLAQRVVCYELVFAGREPEIPDSVIVRSDSILWQKEALLNRALADCRAKYFAWIDHDICLQSPTWLVDALARLDSGAKAVQLFDRITYLDQTYRPLQSKQGRVAGGSAAPGGGWIATAEYLRSLGGFYDRSVVGSGDEWFYSAATNDASHVLDRIHDRLSPAMAADVRTYINRAAGRPANVAHIDCQGFHLWHGDARNRQYATREHILRRHEFDPNRDVRLNEDGVLEWSTNKPAMHGEVKQFFVDRREDG
jgi:hypothetical protein